MKGKTGILVLGVLLFALSYPLQWFSEGGNAARLAFDDSRVRASLDYFASDASNQMIAERGEVLKAWTNEHTRGYKVSLIVLLNEHPWHAWVVFSPGGIPLESAVQLSGGFPVYARRLGIALAAAWLIAGVVGPRLFGRKCPDCAGSFWNPAYLVSEETVVYPGGYDDNADSLSPIVRCDFVCLRCGYKRVTYAIPVTASQSKVFPYPVMVLRASPKQIEMYQKMQDMWFAETRRKTRFHNQSEWRAFYDELKASEREERSRTVR